MKNKWISVEEYLPDHHNTVWICVNKMTVEIGEHDNEWYNVVQGCVISESISDEVTHWMEIDKPIPPNENNT